MGGVGGAGIEQHVGGAEQPIPVGAIGNAAPLLGRGERRDGGLRPAGRVGQRFGDSLHAGIGARVVAGERGQCGLHLCLVERAERFDLSQAHAVLGEGAGLVRAHHVDAGQALDRGQFLDQALAFAQTHHTDREGDRGHQHQALGNHRHQRGDHPGHGGSPRFPAGDQLVVDAEQTGRNEQVGDEFQDFVDTRTQFGVHQRELAGFLRQFRGVGVLADLGRAVGARARHHEAARHHRRADALVDRVGLTGQQRLVDLERGGLFDLAVDHDLIAGTELDQIVQDHLAGRDLLGEAVAAHGRLGLADDRQLVQGPLGPDLLDDADRAVGHDEQPEHAVDDRARRQNEQEQHTENGIDTGEDIRANDLGDRTTRPGRDVVGAPVAATLIDLCCGEPGGRGFLHGYGHARQISRS